jgi:peptide/nickel transport system substrate-binding protein
MRVTIDLNPDAVWDDGTPIGVADFECTWQASVNTPGSVFSAGYDQIAAIHPGARDHQVVVDFTTVYAPYKTLFNTLIKADAVENCSDVSADMATGIPFSGDQWRLDSWNAEQAVLVPNERYFGPEKPNFDEVVVVGRTDFDTEATSIRAGEIDFIAPQYFPGIESALRDADVSVSIAPGTEFEALYFQQQHGPFADPVYRKAFSMSLDRDALFGQVYGSPDGATRRQDCGPIVPGPYCSDAFADSYDPAGATALLDGAGWFRDGQGLWNTAEGKIPRVRWMVNTDNTTRTSAQDYLIPMLRDAGFDVVADNCDSACVFDDRLIGLDYDLALYATSVTADPNWLTTRFACDQIPSEANDFRGLNLVGWCNARASDLLHEADSTIDATRRADLVKEAVQLMADDAVMLPIVQFPTVGAYRTDTLAGPVEDHLHDLVPFSNFGQWEDRDHDGRLLIGAEQWPSCLNPITECVGWWYLMIFAHPVLPGVWNPTNDGGEITPLVTGEPVVDVL